MKRIWSIILTLCLLAGMAPPFTKAAETPTPADTAALSSEADVVHGETISEHTTSGGPYTVDVGGRTGDSQDAAEADSDTLSGTCGDNLTWTLSNGVLTISGTGTMTSYSESTGSPAPWYDNRATITTVVIERGVTSIGSEAFWDCSSLANVTIPEGVTSIGADAFYDCRSLTGVAIPDSVTMLAPSAFNGCRGLESVTIPDGVTAIGTGTFGFCSSLASVTIPNSVTTISPRAFAECGALADVYYRGTEAQWATLQSNIGTGNDPLLNATIHFDTSYTVYTVTVTNGTDGGGTYVSGDSVTITAASPPVGQRFKEWTGVDSLVFTGGSKTTSTATFTMPNSDVSVVATYEAITYTVTVTNGTDGGGEYAENASVTIIANAAPEGQRFKEWTGADSLTFTEGSKTTTPATFTMPDSDVSVTATYETIPVPVPVTVTLNPSTVTLDGVNGASATATAYDENNNAFTSGVTWSVTPSGSGVEIADETSGAIAIAANATAGDYTVTATYNNVSRSATLTVTRNSDTPSGTCGDNLTWTLSNGVLTISGTGPMTDYVSSDGTSTAPWYDSRASIQSVVIESGATSIGNSAFYYCGGLTRVDIPNSVTSIGYYAFQHCSSLASVDIPNSVTSIGDWAFFSCSGLTSVDIPNSVTSIGGYSFYGCSSLASVTIPNSVTSIGVGAFFDCSALAEVQYRGTRAQWNAVTIDDTDDGNAALHSATIHCTDGDIVGGAATFVVTFNGNGGIPESSSVTVQSGGIATPPANPTRDGYEFTGWYTDPQATTAFDFTTPITANTTLYAGWRQHDIPVYAVTFEANGGGSTMNPVTVSGNSYTLPQCGFTPPSHMIFGAWSVNGTEYAPGETISLSGNVTVTALWVDPYGVLGRLQDMDSYMDQTWHLAGPFSEFRTLTIDDTTLTQPDDYTSESGSTKLNIPAGTFVRFGQGTHSIAAEFQTTPDSSDPGDDGRRVTADYYTVKPSGQVTLDAREITGAGGAEAAKAVENVSYTGRFHTVPQLNEEYFRVVVTEGAVPSGLTLHEGGYFTGTPFIAEGQPRTFTFTVGLQVRRNVTDAWPETYADTLEVTIVVEQDTQANVEAQADPGYELVERVPATIELDGEWVHLTSKGPFEEFTDFYIDGVKKVRGVDYIVRPCLINPATDEVVQLLEGGLMTGTFIQLQKSTLGEGTHSLNLEFVKTDPIGNKQTRSASQKVTVRPKSTPVVTPIHNSSGGSGSSGGSSRSTTPTVRTYTVKVSKASHGTLTLSATKVAAGKSVTITAAPNSGYRTESVSVTDSAKKAVKTTPSGNRYTFTMPSRNVTVSASFTPSVYTLTVANSAHGKVTLNRTSASRNTTINGSTTPDKGYLLSSVAVRDANGQSVNVETFNDGKFTFLMPNGRVTVSATFTVKRLASFADIQSPDWFFDDAEWAYNRGILRGVTERYWEPQSLMSSITSIVTLERLDGVDLTPYDTGADDGLDNSAWYVSALRWANANGITLSDRPFGGQAALKRGEFAVMLSNYLRYRGIAVEVPEGATFSDAATMTEDELRAFRTLQAADVFRGYRDGSIRPEAYLNRAQLAALLHRLSGYIIGAETA